MVATLPLESVTETTEQPVSLPRRGTLLIVDDEEGPRQSLRVIFKDDYDLLLARLEEDPNLYKRLVPATLGPDPNLHDSNTVYPRAKAEQLAAARKALIGEPNESAAGATMPKWLSRASEPRRRTMLFISGVVLILTSFVSFRPAK